MSLLLRALVVVSIALLPALGRTQERARPRLEVGAAALANLDFIDRGTLLTGGGFVRGGVRLSSLALALEADGEFGASHGEPAPRIGGYASAAWVHGRLRLGGGLGAAYRKLEAVDIDYLFQAGTLALGPMAEASVDFLQTEHFAGYVGARLRVDIAATSYPAGAVVPGGQLWLGFRMLP